MKFSNHIQTDKNFFNTVRFVQLFSYSPACFLPRYARLRNDGNTFSYSVILSEL